MSRKWMLLFALLLPAVCQAHWTDHRELPDWAQRGKLRWCLHYARADQSLVDLFLDANQTLLHGGTIDSPQTAEYASQHGLRYMPYVCSRTVTTQEIAKNPQLGGAVVLKPDGSEFLAYNNPVRRYGSLYQPAWPEYVRERTRGEWDRPDVAAIFYDNAFFEGDDHNPATIAAWKQWAARHGLTPGDDVPPLSNDPLSAASRLFSADSLTDYHRMLQQFCHSHNPPLLNCPNLGSAYGGLLPIEAGAVDLVFYETMSHPPFDNNFFLYKSGLAASGGRPTSMLAYLPPAVGAERGERTWNEGMHAYFYPSSPVAEECALAAAEGAANNGIYIPCYNLFPSLPITDTTDPFNKRIYRELKRSYGFLKANEELYTAAQPGSDIAVLHSTLTGLQDRRAQQCPQLSKALLAAGIPYEVMATSDLPDGLGKTRTLIVPNVVFMDDRAAAGLLSFVTKGGRAIITGEYATKDPVGRPLQSAAVRQVEAALRLVSKPLSEWTLDGFAPEGPGTFRVVKGAGLASLKFSGQPGQYLAYLNATDESDGESQFSLSVNGQPVCSGKLDYDDDQAHVFKTAAFSLKPGDVVQLTVKPDGGEPGRVHSLVLANAAAETGAPLGAGQVVYSPSGLETMPTAQLLALLQPKVRLPEPGKVCLNVMDVPGRGLQTVHLVNYDFRYDVAHPGRYASDDGTAEKRTYFGSNSTVVRKRVHIDKPDQVIEPVLQLQGSATPDTTAELVATINGRPAARIAATTMGGWVDVPVAPALLQGDNVIELRAEGAVDGVKHWFQIGIDTDTHAGNSEFSTDGGRTFTQADLSPDLQAQTGEYLIRIVDKSPGGERHTADNLARNPGFEQVTTPHGETKLTVAAAKDLKVQVQGASRTALAISPERAPLWLQGQTSGKITTYTVPEVGIYTVLVLGPSRQALQPVYQTQMTASPWSVPPVTEPLRTQVSAWDRFGAGFVTDATVRHGGEHSIACENARASDLRGASQQLEFDATTRQTYQLSAWSRAENVSGSANGDYSIYVDATCTDGTVFNGHATPFATGTHDWQQAKLEITPPAPLKTLRLHLLFRKKTGKVWFDDVQVQARPAR